TSPSSSTGNRRHHHAHHPHPGTVIPRPLRRPRRPLPVAAARRVRGVGVEDQGRAVHRHHRRVREPVLGARTRCHPPGHHPHPAHLRRGRLHPLGGFAEHHLHRDRRCHALPRQHQHRVNLG